jgi:hypothetical protein
MVTKRATTKRKVAAKKPAVARAPRKPKLKRTFWDDLADIGRRIPEEELAKLPTDLAKNFDHYAHGSPRQD